ncbi:MAG: sugar phosphate nucleotidyltransferase [Solirubrobacterales bacterium]
MRAMVMAAGLGTRLRPLTYEVAKPMVPVVNRPIMEHIVRLLAGHGFGELIANLHWFPEPIRDHFGNGSALGVELSWVYEEELLGTAGGVRNVRDYLTAPGGGAFLVMAADALTDVDLAALAAAHAEGDRIATLAVKRVPNVSEFGVVITGDDGRVQGFQEKPDPAEALSDLANCMIYVLEPEVFDYFPEKQEVDFALDVFPALLEHDVPFGVHVADAYWNDIGSLPEYLQGNLDALAGAVRVEPAGVVLNGDGGSLGPEVEISDRVLVGEGVEVGDDVRIDGPAVLGPGARIGAGARIKESVLLPRAEVPAEALLASSIAGRRGALASSA